MERIASRISEIRGWRRYVLAWALGAIAAISLPPISGTFVLLLSFSGLLLLLDGTRNYRDAAWDGWWFGFGFLTIGLYWISNALVTDVEKFGWMIPFALLGLPAFLALFTSLGTIAAKFFWVTGPFRILSLSCGWTLSEIARGHLLTGFPWNLIGYTWSWSPLMMQSASIVGIYGLGFFTVFIASSPGALIFSENNKKPLIVWTSVISALLLSTVLVIYGSIRLYHATEDRISGLNFRIVQANISQIQKWDDKFKQDNLLKYISLSIEESRFNLTHIVWPETAVTYFINDQPHVLAQIVKAIPAGGLLLTGAPRVELDNNGRLDRIFNSIQIINRNGDIVDTYDKSHLVPFGEYVPFRKFLNLIGLNKIVPGNLDYSAGPGPKTLNVPGLPPVSPLVCYEAIFPGGVVDTNMRPAWLLNVTNDGWYGNSSGPYQHFEMVRLRAIEQGLPLIRAANTGISGVIDPWGRVIAKIGLGKVGVIDSELPVATKPTFYSKFGIASPLSLLLSMILVLVVVRRRH